MVTVNGVELKLNRHDLGSLEVIMAFERKTMPEVVEMAIREFIADYPKVDLEEDIQHMARMKASSRLAT